MKTTIGVDLHKCSLTTTVLDEAGKVIERKDIPTKCRNQIQEYFGSYGTSCQVVVESVGFYQWFWDLVRPQVGKLVLADPAGVKAFVGRKAKTDRNDSLLLANLLREERLPMAYVPTEPIRALRELTRLRHSMARSLAAERRHLRWISLKNNLPGPSTLTSDRAQKWILAQENKFSAPHRLAAQKRLDHITALERDVVDIQRAIDRAVEADAEILRQVRLFESIPGIGRLTAVTILVETGDITRFRNIDELSAYAGLAPRVSQSGETVHHGHISKQGPPILRWVLQQAAWTAIRVSPEARKIFTRIGRKAGPKKAATALGRKLLSYAWSVARRGVPFHWPGQPIPTELTDHWSYEI
jgi:transposase